MKICNKNIDLLLKKIILLKSNKHYRFGDVVFKKGYYWRTSRNYIVDNSQLNGTILKMYLHSFPDKSWNDNLSLKEISDKLMRIVNNYIAINKKISIPSPNELVIHLRTGDWAYKNDFLTYNYADLINKYINRYKITKCTFCTAFHYGDFTEKNLWLFTPEIHKKNIDKLKKLFIDVFDKCKIEIDICSHDNPDIDFIYMLKAHYFYGRDGGFASLINNLRRK